MAADGVQGQAYLSTASVYGGSNRDGGGKLPSLPVPGRPRPPACPAARSHARVAGSRPLAARAPRLALQNAHLKLSFGRLRLSPVARARQKTHIFPRRSLHVVLVRFCTPSDGRLYFCLPRQASPWAPLCGHGGLREPSGKRSHGVLSLVVKVTRERLSQACAGEEGGARDHAHYSCAENRQDLPKIILGDGDLCSVQVLSKWWRLRVMHLSIIITN